MLLVIAFACFVTVNGVGDGILNMVDHKFPFSFSDLLMNQLYLWNDRIFLGFNQGTSLTLNLPYTALFALIERTGLNYVVINRVEYILALFANIYFTYLYLTAIFSHKLNFGNKIILLLAATFFTTNILFHAFFVTGLSPLIFSLSFIGLSLYSSIKLHSTKNPLFFLLLIVSMIFIGSYNYPYALLALITYALGIFSYNAISVKKRILSIIVFLFLWSLLNSYWLIPLFYSTFISPSFNVKDVVVNDSNYSYTLVLLKDTFRLTNLFQLSQNMYQTMRLTGLKSFIMRYYYNTLVQIILYIPLFSIFITFLLNKKESNRKLFNVDITFLVYVLIVALFLAKGLAEPFGNIYDNLFSSNLVFLMFRNPQKWMLISYFIVVVIMAYLLIIHENKLVKKLIFLFLIISIIPWLSGDTSGGLKAYNVPSYYFDFKKSYDFLPNLSNDRALILQNPEDTYTPYVFRNEIYNSSNIVKFLSPIPIVDLFSNGNGLGYCYLENLYQNLKRDDTDISVFQESGVTHLYHQRDLKEVENYKYTEKYFTKSSFGNFDVYQLKNEYQVPHINVTTSFGAPRIEYVKINPTHYKISIQNIRKDFRINFLYTFDNNWGLYLTPYVNNPCVIFNESKLDIKTSKPSESGTGVVKECLIDSKNIGHNATDLLKIPDEYIQVGNHAIVNKYANSWLVDSAEITSNHTSGYYVKNADGSINLNFDLFFTPQIYFNRSLIFSLSLLVALFVVTIYCSVRYYVH